MNQFIFHFLFLIYLSFQGLPGEKGQKGDLGQPAIDVFQAVKVFFNLNEILLFLFPTFLFTLTTFLRFYGFIFFLLETFNNRSSDWVKLKILEKKERIWFTFEVEHFNLAINIKFSVPKAVCFFLWNILLDVIRYMHQTLSMRSKPLNIHDEKNYKKM